MIAPEDETIRKIEQALTKAHQARQAPPLGREWTDGVMREVRRQGIRARPAGTPAGLETLIWRTAVFASAFALILTLSILVASLTPSHEGVSLVAEEVESGALFLE